MGSQGLCRAVRGCRADSQIGHSKMNEQVGVLLERLLHAIVPSLPPRIGSLLSGSPISSKCTASSLSGSLVELCSPAERKT
jgi:hypothetical protein